MWFQDFWISAIFGVWILITKLFCLVEMIIQIFHFWDLKLLCSIYLNRYWDFKMCPKATLLPRRRSKWFWAQFCIPITFLKICHTALLDPKNKRLKSQFPIEENSLIISVIVFPDLTTNNDPKFQNREIYKKKIFLFMGASFLNAMKSLIFGVRLCFFLQITYFCLYFLAMPLDFTQQIPVLL